MNNNGFQTKDVISLAIADAKKYRSIENKLLRFCLESMEQGLDVIPIAYLAAIFGWSDREVLKDE